jgi:hypothetical protein
MVNPTTRRWLLAVAALVAAACGPSKTGIQVDLADGDDDGIADGHEGKDEGRDTDDDGVPDWQDDDSDGDGIDDADEAGDDATGSPPIDTDADGTPDFQDLDADGNGIADADESTEDVDGDGRGAWQDVDDDGDAIDDAVELGGDPGAPLDTDGDGTPDYLDLDSDADTIADEDDRASDADGDGVRNFRDLDSDADCIADALEAGDANLATRPRDTDDDGSGDFVDVDADADGLADGAEDADCDGTVDPGETSAAASDTDGDGATDLVEDAAGTDALDPSDNPQANGDFVFLVPYEDDPSPAADDLDFSTTLKDVDVYVLLDLSGSMSDELASVHANLGGVLDALTCAPAGSGQPGACIPALWSGLGTLTYAERAPFASRIRMQSNPDAIGNASLAADTGACSGCAEPHWLALWLAATGLGTASSGCSGLASVAAAPSCASSPAGAAGVGYPCFRPDALPVILVATDEAPSASYTCPSQATALSALVGAGAKVIGIAGSGVTSSTTTWTDLAALARGTGAVDAGGGAMVYAGAGAGASDAIEDAIRAVAHDLPLDMGADATDDPADGVDAVAAFVARLETLELGTAACADGLTTQDTDGDGIDDRFVDVLPGTGVCWNLVARENTTVPATSVPQLFRATVDVRGDGVTLLDTRDVYFLVPPSLAGPGVE